MRILSDAKPQQQHNYTKQVGHIARETKNIHAHRSNPVISTMNSTMAMNDSAPKRIVRNGIVCLVEDFGMPTLQTVEWIIDRLNK